MVPNLFALLSFVLITTFTPGPNNIASASMGVLHGYKNTVQYLLGITVGFFITMLLSATISVSLLNLTPSFEPVLRLVGAGYILYLAYATLKASYTFEGKKAKPMGFASGLMLQLLNPKALIYGLTLFSTFLVSITGNVPVLLVAAILLAAVTFCATSTWALFGTAIRTYLHQKRVKMAVNTVLAILLIYTALEIAGLL